MKQPVLFVTAILFFLCSGIAEAETIKNIGYSFVRNYSKDSYSAATQNWDIEQDTNGLLYFANGNGLLQFDGTYWQLYPLPNKSMVRAVCIDKEGNIWVGGFNQIGYFSPEENGRLVYHSVINLLEPQYRDFGEIWEIYQKENRLIIQTFTSVFEYKDGLIRPLVWNVDIHYSFYANNNYYVKVNNVGLHELVNNELILVPGGELLAEHIVSAIIPKNQKEYFIFTANEGIFLMNKSGITRFTSSTNNLLIKNQVFDAIKYDNYILTGTIQDGLFILDNNCNLIQHINRSRGLQNNTILSLFVDREKNLWLGLDNGIDYVKINSPLSFIANKNEIGAGYQSMLFKDKLYLGTNQGLYTTDWPMFEKNRESANFNTIEGLQGQVWMLKQYNNQLFCGHDKGTFVIDNYRSKQISDIAGASNLFNIPGTDFILQGTYSGLIVLEKNGNSNNWVFRNKISGFNYSAKNIYIDDIGNIWVGHDYKGIYKLSLTSDCRKVLKQKHYGKDQGLPELFGLNMLQFEDLLVISSDKGFYYYNAEKDYFLPHEALNTTFKTEVATTFIRDPYNKNTWFFSDSRMGILKPNFDGSYNLEYIPFLELSGKFLTKFETLYFLDNTNIIITTEDGFIHFDPTYKKKYNTSYKTLIRSIKNQNDSLIYEGNRINNASPDRLFKIKYHQNSLKISFSAPIYDIPKPIEYSIKLEGFDKNWSEWSTSAEKEYTNLPAGKYTYYVKARNIFGFESDNDKITFTVLPPWYQSWTAYIIYVLIIVLSITLIVIYVIKRFEKEKSRLKEKQSKELKEREKEFERETMKAEQEIIKLRNEKLEFDNQRKQGEIENKTKELAAIAMQITYKNEMLSKVSQKLSKVTQKMIHQESKQQVLALIKTLEKDMVKDDEWEKFEISFDQVHEDFLKKLRTNFTDLSPKDLRLCAYLRMNLSSKEIAPLLNISIRGVEISRYRLRRKLNIDRDTNLTEFMMKL